MRFALDYDGTYTADPPLWDRFIADLRSRGHGVLIVTSRRYAQEDYNAIHETTGCAVVFTDMQAKQSYCEARGLRIDVWIDDDPRCITEGK